LVTEKELLTDPLPRSLGESGSKRQPKEGEAWGKYFHSLINDGRKKTLGRKAETPLMKGKVEG